MYGAVSYNANPPTTPQEIAVRTKCDPSGIAYWIGQSIDYKETAGWESAQACLDRGTGDCKCKATIAEETLLFCIGYDYELASLYDGENRHAVVLFQDYKGRYGFIDGSRGKVTAAKDYDDLIDFLPGGPWTRYR